MTEDRIAERLPMLRRYAHHLSRSATDADDLAQETVMRTLQRMRDGDAIEDIDAYMKAVLRNLSRRPKRQHAPIEDVDDPALAPDALRRIALMDVLRVVGTLPHGQAELLETLVREDLAYGDMADRLDIPIGTVMSRLSRARSALRDALDLPGDHAVETLLEGCDELP